MERRVAHVRVRGTGSLGGNLAFADPPYTTGQSKRLRDLFRARPFANILGIEHQATLDLAGDDTRRYGSVALTFFRAP